MSDSQICPSCGAASPADAQFCRDCGAILVRSGSAPKPPAASTPSFTFGDSRGPESPPPPSGNRTSALVVVVIIIVLFVIAAIFFGKREASQIPVPGESPTEVPATPQPTEPPPPPRREPTERPAPPPPPPREREPAREPDIVREAPEPGAEREPRPEREPERLPAETRPRQPERRREPGPPLPRVESEPDGRLPRAGWYRVKFRAPLFQSPDERAPIVTYLRPGTRIRVTHVVPGFLAVESTTGKAPGYVSSDDAVPEGSQ